MALFRYTFLTSTGKKTGIIDADSYLLAKDRLLKEKILVTELVLVEEKQKRYTLTPALRLAFTREIAQLLKAGLPLYESLLTIEEKYQKTPAHPLFLDLCDALKTGTSLSTALSRYPHCFDEIYLALVRSGEQSGALIEVFAQLALLLHRQQALRKQIISAVTYPALLGGFCVLMVMVLFFFVVPSLKELFEGRDLHPLTACVLSISNFLTAHRSFFFFSLLLLPLLAVYFFKRREGKVFWHRLVMKVPFFKSVMLHSALVRFFRAASLLLLGGVPFIQALSLSRKTMNHAPLEDVVARSEIKIAEGEKLSAQFKASPLFPPLVFRMLAIGEETGNMASMMVSLAEIYDEEVGKSLGQLTSLLQPLLLLLLGGIVGLVILSILLPLTDVGSFLGG